jgi:carbamoyltransferase
MLYKVNRLKQRESWRPLGPGMTKQSARAVFGRDVSGPFMLLAHCVPPDQRPALPAVVHVDGTTRPQIVLPEMAPTFHQILGRFESRTGVPGLVNTSFNVGGPIVATPKDAVATFMTSPMDALLIEGHLVQKQGSR